ncbi:MAG: hypothetical protein MPW13_02305 [Candidatus Manganitrophus sp.]|nr:hypothetical protein [Candidatus Manganitrophus sp.]
MKKVKWMGAAFLLGSVLTGCAAPQKGIIQDQGFLSAAGFRVIHADDAGKRRSMHHAQRLGEIIIDASVEPSPPISDVEQKLREEAGRLGADAVVIVYDSIQPSVVFVNPWWGGNMRTVPERQLVGVAIKYQGEAEEAPG